MGFSPLFKLNVVLHNFSWYQRVSFDLVPVLRPPVHILSSGKIKHSLGETIAMGYITSMELHRIKHNTGTSHAIRGYPFDHRPGWTEKKAEIYV